MIFIFAAIYLLIGFVAGYFIVTLKEQNTFPMPFAERWTKIVLITLLWPVGLVLMAVLMLIRWM